MHSVFSIGSKRTKTIFKNIPPFFISFIFSIHFQADLNIPKKKSFQKSFLPTYLNFFQGVTSTTYFFLFGLNSECCNQTTQRKKILCKQNFVCFDALRPSQQFISRVRMSSCLPEWNQYLAVDKVSCTDSCESQTSNPSIHSLTLQLSHCVPQ